jgi:hypothetical protein
MTQTYIETFHRDIFHHAIISALLHVSVPKYCTHSWLNTIMFLLIHRFSNIVMHVECYF